MTSFAAEPGTFLVSVDDPDSIYLIVGWMHTTGLNVVPLVIGHPGPLVAGHGIEFKNETVLDLMTNTAWSDAESWRENFLDNPTYRAGSPIRALRDEPPVPPAPRTDVTPAKSAFATEPLVFSGKTYAKASFWKAPTGGREVVFILTPEHPSPLAPAQKITRDAFFEARKSIPEVTLDSLTSPVDDQPELPLGDEDDDGNDLI